MKLVSILNSDTKGGQSLIPLGDACSARQLVPGVRGRCAETWET
uniref:Uncharacterized protein n=1 Tax=Anguilla anguilla TaxID=7936 RepID=A0A0E9R616_ANGAN